MKQIESIKEWGGFLNRYTHQSTTCHCEMTFSVYLPPQAAQRKVPAVYWLSGLTCTDDNARVKAGAQRYAAELGLALIFPDTSPRGDDVPDVAERYDMGKGAGFYVDATQQPWSKHYQMYAYITQELPALLEASLPLIPGRKSVTGHSMGGHGALLCALRNPDAYAAVSAFAPICNPVNSGWGKECFGAYLGNDETMWDAYDATRLIQKGARCAEILIDQGVADEFYEQGELLTANFIQACEIAKQPLTLRYQAGYDHSYHFIASFIGEHLRFHAARLA